MRLLFLAGMKKYEFKGKQFHEQCFNCKVCRQPIGTKTFIPRETEAVCIPCYEEQYAQRCVKCNGVSRAMHSALPIYLSIYNIYIALLRCPPYKSEVQMLKFKAKNVSYKL